MATTTYIFEGISTSIQCQKDQKMKYISDKYCSKINVDINTLIFLYGGNKLDMEKKYEDYSKENSIKILVYENTNDVCPKCGKLLGDEKIDKLISSNNNINSILFGLTSQINHIIEDLNNNKQIDEINYQLKNINLVLNHIIEDIKKINEELNKAKNSNIENNTNEIICIFDKQDPEINILHDFKENISGWRDNDKKAYIEGKKNINEKNFELFINDKKIKYNNKYKSDEIGEIKATFKFNKLLANTSCMFRNCSSLKSIDLSKFNAANVNGMNGMSEGCSSLVELDFSSINTIYVNDMSYMFCDCSSIKS